MMDFQREPDPRDVPTTCDKCHEVLTTIMFTSENEQYCPHCGHVLGHCIQPSVWACEECGDVSLHHGGDERPRCSECRKTMVCVTASPSRIHGAGINNKELDLGLEYLMEAQEADLKLGSDILEDMQDV